MLCCVVLCCVVLCCVVLCCVVLCWAVLFCFVCCFVFGLVRFEHTAQIFQIFKKVGVKLYHIFL